MADIIQTTYGEIENFYKELLDSKTPRVKKFTVYNIYKTALDENNAKKELEDNFALSHRGGKYYANIISDDIVIFTNTLRTEEYYPCLYIKNSNNIIDLQIISKDFDEAILAAIACKYYGNNDPVKWMEVLIKKETVED